MASVAELKKELISELHQACITHLDSMTKDLGGQLIFAYALYCSEGCRNINVAACTREGLRERARNPSNHNEPEWYPEVVAAEWNYVNTCHSFFSRVDEKIDEIYEVFYEGDPDDINLDALDTHELWDFISDFFIDVSVGVFNSMKDEGCFNSDNFENELLLGIQFGDPDRYSVRMIEESSERLNSEKWHNKILQATRHLHG